MPLAIPSRVLLLLALLGCLCSCAREDSTPWAALGSVAAGASSPAGAPGTLEDQLIRRFAPQLRYNAFHDDGDSSRNNRNEDFFPGDVSLFFEQLASGTLPVITQLSDRHTPATIRWLPNADVPSFDADELGGYPDQMAGSEPGLAPTYTHIYEDAAARQINPDGSETRTYFIEYWQWYPYDWACARFLYIFGCEGGHRGDWEHTAYRVVATVDGTSLLAASLDQAYFYGHGRNFVVDPATLTRVDDLGRPGGEHPVVFLAMGKHAAYPEAGELHDYATIRLFSDHDDFFRGNGVWINTLWGDFIDISAAAVAANPAAVATPAFQTIVARSVVPPLPSWLHWDGRWGPDLDGLQTPLGYIIWASSPTGPWQKGSWGDAPHDGQDYLAWKQNQGKLQIYVDLGVSIPRANPLPLPIAR